jgi:hypothetical protein
MVKITKAAHDRIIRYKGNSRNHLETQVTGFRFGLEDTDDDLLDAFCYGVAIVGNLQRGIKVN